MALSKTEEYIQRTGRLPVLLLAAVNKSMRDCGYDLGMWSATSVKLVKVPTWVAGLSTRKGGDPRFFSVGMTVYYVDGAFSGIWEPNTPYRFSEMCHELFHTYQTKRDGLGNMVAKYVWALIKGRGSWIHDEIPFELEAIEYQKKVYDWGFKNRTLIEEANK